MGKAEAEGLGAVMVQDGSPREGDAQVVWQGGEQHARLDVEEDQNLLSISVSYGLILQQAWHAALQDAIYVCVSLLKASCVSCPE